MSVAKWEAKWHKPFLGKKSMENDELLDYIRCMTINPQKNPNVYNNLLQEDLLEIVQYMQDPQSAWTIRQQKQRKPVRNKQPDTSETIYYVMIQYGIPLECEKWHLNRLMSLIDYCDAKGGSTSGYGGQKKRSEKEIMEMYRAMNEKNRKKYNSKG